MGGRRRRSEAGRGWGKGGGPGLGPYGVDLLLDPDDPDDLLELGWSYACPWTRRSSACSIRSAPSRTKSASF